MTSHILTYVKDQYESGTITSTKTTTTYYSDSSKTRKTETSSRPYYNSIHSRIRKEDSTLTCILCVNACCIHFLLLVLAVGLLAMSVSYDTPLVEVRKFVPVSNMSPHLQTLFVKGTHLFNNFPQMELILRSEPVYNSAKPQGFHLFTPSMSKCVDSTIIEKDVDIDLSSADSIKVTDGFTGTEVDTRGLEFPGQSVTSLQVEGALVFTSEFQSYVHSLQVNNVVDSKLFYMNASTVSIENPAKRTDTLSVKNSLQEVHMTKTAADLEIHVYANGGTLGDQSISQSEYLSYSGATEILLDVGFMGNVSIHIKNPVSTPFKNSLRVRNSLTEQVSSNGTWITGTVGEPGPSQLVVKAERHVLLGHPKLV